MDWKDALGDLLASGSVPVATDPWPAYDTAGAGTALTKTTLRVAYERKGRGGKAATIIYGFDGREEPARIEALASSLKRALGIGGSARGSEILLQGDQRTPKLKALLEAKGYRVKGFH